MIKYKKGDLLESDAQVLVNTVNLVGVMGKGLALQFKNRFPDNFKSYKSACADGSIGIGKVFVTTFYEMPGRQRYIVNFPTKTTWRKPSEYQYIEAGLKSLKEFIISNSIESIAIPPLGARNGGLDWNHVKEMIEIALYDVANCRIEIYEPSDQVLDKMKDEKVKLTPARAMLLDVLCDLVSNGEFVSEFAAEKIVYFFERFGCRDIFKVSYSKAPYGPYSGKVRYVLQTLNGSYLMGIGEMQQKPFDEIWLLPETSKDVNSYLGDSGKELYRQKSELVKEFLNGFYSNFSLELLATVDFILVSDNTYAGWTRMDQESVCSMVMSSISDWSVRKERLFNKKEYIDIMLTHLKEWNNRGLIPYE